MNELQKLAFYAACPSAFLDKHTIYDLGSWLKFCQAAAKVDSAQVFTNTKDK